MEIETGFSEVITRNAWQRVFIETIRPETRMATSFRLRPQQWFTFQAGQHVNVRLTAPGGYQAQRSYSVASSPEDHGFYELVIDRLEDGEVSGWFHDVAQVGDHFDMRGPFGGHFVWSPQQSDAVLFLSGGSGVVPILSMLRHRAHVHTGALAVLIAAARHWDDVIGREELLRLEEADHTLTVLFALSRHRAQRPQDFGHRVNAEVVRSALERLPVKPANSYVCGSNTFVEAATSEILLSGIAASTIRTERF